ncbi:MAG: PaaI family thioesterase [Spirochaetota bacterium]|nr:PaaI family thioesterase [Spirochaetota bacterium]
MVKEFPQESKDFHPFGELIGLKFDKLSKGFSQCSISVDEKMFNPHQVLHGAIMYGMADTGMGGALYTLIEDTEICATIEIKINFFKAVRHGKVTCKTKVIQKGKRIATLESEIFNDKDLVAKALGTYSIIEIKS